MNLFPSIIILLLLVTTTSKVHAAWIGIQQNKVINTKQGRQQLKIFTTDKTMRTTSTRTAVILKASSSTTSSNKLKDDDDDDNDIGGGIRISNTDYYSLIVASFLQQAMVPLADLMNGALLYSQLQDPNILGAIGIARASQSVVSKLYTSPLSKTSISLIASKAGQLSTTNQMMMNQANATLTDVPNVLKRQQQELVTAVMSGLVLAMIVGFVQLFVFTICARPILALNGITPATTGASIGGNSGNMYKFALLYTRARATSAPSSTMWLVATGACRALGDATAPLYCAILFNAMNILLNYLFVSKWRLFGIVQGVPILTAVAQTVSLIPLLLMLRKRLGGTFVSVTDSPRNKKIVTISETLMSILASLRQYFLAGVYLMARSLVRVVTTSYCTRYAALLGPVAASSYTILSQIGLWVTMMCESIAIAIQSVLARQQPRLHPTLQQNRFVNRSFQLGIFVSCACSVALIIWGRPIVAVFSNNIEIQQSAILVLPWFCLTQLVKGICFPMNGMLMGRMNWGTSFLGMCLANVACFIALYHPGHLTVAPSARRLWIAWSSYYIAQTLAGIIRFYFNEHRNSRFRRLQGRIYRD